MTSTIELQKIKFRPKKEKDFAAVVKERVDTYLATNKISRHADREMIMKTSALLISLVVIYSAIISQAFSLPVTFFLSMLIGLNIALISVNIPHDALHGSYSAHPLVNRAFGYLFDVLGFSSYVWKITHNFAHHTYTNIPGADPDIEKAAWLRLSPKDKLYWFHRYQHIYVFFLYGLTGINWTFFSDYVCFLGEKKKKPPTKTDTVLFFSFKALNAFIFLAVPLLFTSYSWWQVLLGFLGLQFAGGLTVAIIFQLAHLVEDVSFPSPDAVGMMEHQWAEHEMRTTANFDTNNPFVNYVCGGLNFQVEHHLFPYVCHVHYSKIAPIVRETAREFNLPYHENHTMVSALFSHLRHLKKLGSSHK